MGHVFGKKSLEKLETCHPDLQKIMKLAISRSFVDFGISEGMRSVERQKELFDKGLSKIDGVTRKGKHNYDPSQAVDIYCYHSNPDTRRKIAYDMTHLAFVAGVIQSCAVELKNKGDITSDIRWGGNWNSDGVLVFDQSFIDGPNHEIKLDFVDNLP